MTADPLFRAAKKWEEDITSPPAKTKAEGLGDPLFHAAKQWEEEITESKSREKLGKKEDCHEDAFMAELEQLMTTRNDPLMLAAMDWERKTLFGNLHPCNAKHRKRHSEPGHGGSLLQAPMMGRLRRNSCTQIGEECGNDRDGLERLFNNWQG